MLRHPTSPIGAGSKSYLEVKPIDSVTLSDGRAWKNARRPADLYVGLSRRIAWRWPADPGDLRLAFAARGRLAGCGGQRGGRARGRGTKPSQGPWCRSSGRGLVTRPQ